MVPLFVFVMVSGDIWVASNLNDMPTGSVAATFRVCSLAHIQKLGTVTGNTGAYACSGGLVNKFNRHEEKI